MQLLCMAHIANKTIKGPKVECCGIHIADMNYKGWWKHMGSVYNLKIYYRRRHIASISLHGVPLAVNTHAPLFLPCSKAVLEVHFYLKVWFKMC